MTKRTKKCKITSTHILNILTVVLIIVTVFSIKATNKITEVSLYLDELRQKEIISSRIENIKKLDIELQANEVYAKEILEELPTYRDSTLVPNVKFSIIILNTLGNDIGDLDSELIGDIQLIKDLLVILNDNIWNTWQHKNNMQKKDDSIDRLQQNLNVLLNVEGENYNIRKLIFDLHGVKVELDKKLKQLRKNEKERT